MARACYTAICGTDVVCRRGVRNSLLFCDYYIFSFSHNRRHPNPVSSSSTDNRHQSADSSKEYINQNTSASGALLLSVRLIGLCKRSIIRKPGG